MHFSRIVTNLVGAQTRYETLHGKTYLVVPTVALTVGVHNGSEGAVFYPSEELSKTPVVWNAKPIVIDHPAMNGEGVSACDPKILEAQSVGLIMNAAYDGRLKWESWLDEDRFKIIDNVNYQKIKRGEMVEGSTGLFHDPEPSPGSWNGEAYSAIVRNIRPDHYAILTKGEGACSVKDGGGLLRNADGSTLSYQDIRDQLRTLVKGSAGDSYCYVIDIYPKYAIYENEETNYKVGYKVSKDGKVSIVGEPEKVRKMTHYVTANGERIINEEIQGPLKKPQVSELSYPMRRQQMEGALKEKYAGVQQEGDWGGWVTDVYANYVMYSKDGKSFRLPYTYSDDKINFLGDEEEVERVSEYRQKKQVPFDGTSSPATTNQEKSGMSTNPTVNVMHKGAHDLFHDPSQHQDTHLAPGGASDGQIRTSAGGSRKDEVDKLISGHGWAEEDRKFLTDLPDDHFKKVSSFSAKGASQPIVPYTYDGIGDRSNAHASTHNQANDPEAYIRNMAAPQGVKDMLLNSLKVQKAARTRLVGLITNYKGNVFTKEWLETQDTDVLNGIASICVNQVQQAQAAASRGNYGGQADPEIPILNRSTATITDNAMDDVLPMAPGFFTPEPARQTA